MRPKLYSFKIEDEKETLKAKGVKKNVIKNTLLFEDYKECLFSEKEVMRNMNIIRSHNHDIYSITGIKTGINKKVIGKFKDEASGKQITHFVGLRPKLYSFKIEDEKETLKAKGVKKNVIKNTLLFEDYKECLFSEKEVMRNMNIIRSHNHDIYSITVNKIALSSNDDKRMICEDKINTKALR